MRTEETLLPNHPLAEGPFLARAQHAAPLRLMGILALWCLMGLAGCGPKANNLYQQAVIAQKQTNWAQVKENCKKAVTLDPKHAQAWFLLGQAQAKTNNAAGAVEAYQKAEELAPGNVEALNYLAAYNFQQNNFTQAQAQFASLAQLTQDPAQRDQSVLRSEMLGEFIAAKKKAEEVTPRWNIKEPDPETGLTLAEAQLMQAKTYALFNNDQFCKTYLKTSRIIREAVEKKLAEAEAGKTLPPEQLAAYTARLNQCSGEQLLLMYDPVGAHPYFIKAAQLRPEDARAQFVAGQFSISASRTGAEIRPLFEKAIQLAPAEYPYQLFYARYLVNYEKDYTQARAVLDRLKSTCSDAAVLKETDELRQAIDQTQASAGMTGQATAAQ